MNYAPPSMIHIKAHDPTLERKCWDKGKCWHKEIGVSTDSGSQKVQRESEKLYFHISVTW